MNKERKYYFYVNDSPTGRKKKKISVKESELNDKQKEQIYVQFLDYFAGLPSELSDRFMKMVIINLNAQAQNITQ
jgi:hypothetical protein